MNTQIKDFMLIQEINSNEDIFILVNRDEIAEVIDFGEEREVLAIKEGTLTKERLNKLNKYIKENEDFNCTEDEINDWLKDKNIKVEELYNEVDQEDQPVIRWNDGKFDLHNLLNYGTEWVYRYWDGHNYKVMWIEDPDPNLGYNKGDIEWHSLDEWDGRNWKFKSQHNHGRIGIKEPDKIYLKEYTDYQGSQTTIEILENYTPTEIEEKINFDVEIYVEGLKPEIKYELPDDFKKELQEMYLNKTEKIMRELQEIFSDNPFTQVNIKNITEKIGIIKTLESDIKEIDKNFDLEKHWKNIILGFFNPENQKILKESIENLKK